jgi:DNA-binding transcriptional LysR family regulator
MAVTTDREDLDLSLLRTFLAVVQHGSMGRTASAVAKTQPAVSQQMSRLEKIIGPKLFSRSRNGMELTNHGELLVAYANRAVDLNEEALARLREESAFGPVRLGVSEETVLSGLTPALKRFQRTHPDVELRLTVAGPAKLELLLAQGELDFIISDPARITGLPVIEWRSHLTWLASTDLSIDPFKTLPLVLCASTGLWRDQILSALRNTGWEWRVVFESGSLDATQAAVELGLGVSALLRETVRNAGIREVHHARLPVLPEVRFGMFRSQGAGTRARVLMETALVTSLRTVTRNLLGQSSEGRAWPSSEDSRPNAKMLPGLI